VTDIDGEVFQHVEYFPFGETWVEEHSNRQRTPYLFTGKELDEDTGLYYFGARYYDPRTSVWQSPDPVLADYLKGERSGDGVLTPVNLNLYGYVQQRPLVMLDPDGNETLAQARQSLTDRGVAQEGSRSLGRGQFAPEYSDTQVFNEWLRLERADTSWQEGIPNCPNRVRAEAGYVHNNDGEAWRPLEEVGFFEGRYHPDAKLSMRSQPNEAGAGCQCIYERNGVLVEQGQFTKRVRGNMQDRAGSMDRVSPGSIFTDPMGVLDHRANDVSTYDLAGKLNRLGEYFEVRPLRAESSEALE
jgi:RHS repeat-associated protein